MDDLPIFKTLAASIGAEISTFSLKEIEIAKGNTKASLRCKALTPF